MQVKRKGTFFEGLGQVKAGKSPYNIIGIIIGILEVFYFIFIR